MKKLALTFAAVCCTAFSFNASAATNPGAVTYGSTTGDINITVVKNEAMRVSNLDDIDFGTTESAPGALSDAVCLYSTSGNYFLTASSSNGSGPDFRMSDGTNFIVYDVTWNDGTTTTNMDDAVKSAAAFTGADTANDTCNGATNSTIEVAVNAASFNAAPLGAYADTLTLLFEAQ